MTSGDLFVAFFVVALAIALGFVVIACVRMWRGPTSRR